MQKEDEVEVVHLEWERVEDPTRPSRVRRLLGQPNPLRRPMSDTTIGIAWLVVTVVVVLVQWVVRA
jgi:hypothetical protein